MTEFEITDDNRPYLEARGKSILNACPGSGKTTAVAYKLIELVKECRAEFGHYSGIACLSFTNVAKDEISKKYRSFSSANLPYPHLVSTIDSFVNQFITLPFFYLLRKPCKRPVILDSISFLDNLALGNFKNKKGTPLRFSHKPSELRIELDKSYTWKGTKPNASVVDIREFNKYAKAYKTWQFENGYLNNDDSTYAACYLMESFPQIAIGLANRFPYIIVDEAQDTSEMQYRIFDLLIEGGLRNIEFVGDPYQSLYEFREARPDLFMQRFRDTTNWNALRLSNCRRSSQNIINSYSIFRAKDETNIQSICFHKSDHKLKVLRYDESNLIDLIMTYEQLVPPEYNKQILVRGQKHLELFGVKQTLENPWKSDAAKKLVEAKMFYEQGHSKACVDLIRQLVVEARNPDLQRREQIDQLQSLKVDSKANIQFHQLGRDLPSIDATIKSWTEEVEAYLDSRLGFKVPLQLKKNKGKDYYNQNVKALFYPSVTVPYSVTTVHKAKGMTFHSVLLILSDDSAGAKISINDFNRPEDLPSESQRIIYVALSRPEMLACIAVPRSVDEERIINIFGESFEFA